MKLYHWTTNQFFDSEESLFECIRCSDTPLLQPGDLDDSTIYEVDQIKLSDHPNLASEVFEMLNDYFEPSPESQVALRKSVFKWFDETSIEAAGSRVLNLVQEYDEFVRSKRIKSEDKNNTICS